MHENQVMAAHLLIILHILLGGGDEGGLEVGPHAALPAAPVSSQSRVGILHALLQTRGLRLQLRPDRNIKTRRCIIIPR